MAEHTVESTAQIACVNEGVVLAQNQTGGDKRDAIKRDGVLNNNILSCLSFNTNLNIPDVSSVTPINVDNLALQLCSHPDRRRVDYVLNGLRNGFRLGFHSESTTLKSAKANCPSALAHPSVITKYLAKEVSLGRVFGPTPEPALDNLQISRFGVIVGRSASVMYQNTSLKLLTVLALNIVVFRIDRAMLNSHYSFSWKCDHVDAL